MNSISFSSPTSNRVDAYDVRVLQSDSVCLVMAYYVQILGVTRLRCTRYTGVLGTRGDIYGRCGYFDMGCIEGWLSAIRPLLIVGVGHPLPFLPPLCQVASLKEALSWSQAIIVLRFWILASLILFLHFRRLCCPFFFLFLSSTVYTISIKSSHLPGSLPGITLLSSIFIIHLSFGVHHNWGSW